MAEDEPRRAYHPICSPGAFGSGELKTDDIWQGSLYKQHWTKKQPFSNYLEYFLVDRIDGQDNF